MAHTLPPLPYAATALEPHIDALTMTIHHDKHHNAYVTNLNWTLPVTHISESVRLGVIDVVRMTAWAAVSGASSFSVTPLCGCTNASFQACRNGRSRPSAGLPAE